MSAVRISAPDWLPDELVNDRQCGFIEGYAAACEDIRRELTGDGGSGKSYDPMHIVDGVMHSYAFNMKDGGRHHPLSQYDGLRDVLSTLLTETLEWIHDSGDDDAVAEIHAAFLAQARGETPKGGDS